MLTLWLIARLRKLAETIVSSRLHSFFQVKLKVSCTSFLGFCHGSVQVKWNVHIATTVIEGDKEESESCMLCDIVYWVGLNKLLSFITLHTTVGHLGVLHHSYLTPSHVDRYTCGTRTEGYHLLFK